MLLLVGEQGELAGPLHAPLAQLLEPAGHDVDEHLVARHRLAVGVVEQVEHQQREVDAAEQFSGILA